MELVPVPLVPTCPTKWVYKAVKKLYVKKGAAGKIFRAKLRHRKTCDRKCAADNLFYWILMGVAFVVIKLSNR